MARPIWNGTVSFGLLNIPVQLYSGDRSMDLHFRLLDSRDRNPVRYERINSETGEEVPWKEVVKGFEYAKGNYVVLDEEEIRKAAPEATETVEIEAFVERAAISPMYFEKPYYLVPGKRAEKGYVLLREVLGKTGKVGIARLVIRTREYLGALMPLEDALIVNLMRFPQELVQSEEFKLPKGNSKSYKVTPREMEMASQLLESMSAKWNPEDYKDEFRARLRKLIDERVAQQAGKKPKRARAEPTPPQATTNVVDFMSLLKRSLEKKGESKEEVRRRTRPTRTRRKSASGGHAKRGRAARRKVS